MPKSQTFDSPGGVDANHDLIHQRKVVLESNIAAPKFVDLVNRALPISLKTSNAPSSALLTQFNHVSCSECYLIVNSALIGYFSPNVLVFFRKQESTYTDNFSFTELIERSLCTVF